MAKKKDAQTEEWTGLVNTNLGFNVPDGNGGEIRIDAGQPFEYETLTAEQIKALKDCGVEFYKVYEVAE